MKRGANSEGDNNDHLALEEPANKKRKYAPYIHGTNSSIFTLLEKTQFNICSPLPMIEKYHAAPICGEINRGGHKFNSSMEDATLSLGKLDSTEGYTKDKIISYAYGNHGSTSATYPLRDLSDQINETMKNNFIDMDLLIIFLARCKQKDQDYSDELSNIKIPLALDKTRVYLEGDLEKHFALALQLHYFYLLLAKHLFVDINKINSYPEVQKEKLIKSLGAYFSDARIKQIIDSNGIDVKDILENPTEEKISQLINVLQVPPHAKAWGGYLPFECNFPESQFFTSINNCKEKIIDGHDFLCVSSSSSKDFSPIFKEIDEKYESVNRFTHILTPEKYYILDTKERTLSDYQLSDRQLNYLKQRSNFDSFLNTGLLYHYQPVLTAEEIKEIRNVTGQSATKGENFRQGICMTNGFGSVIYSLASEEICPNDIQVKIPKHLELISHLGQKFKTFLEMKDMPNDDFVLSEKQKKAIKKAAKDPIPLIMVVEDESKAYLMNEDQDKNEYRAYDKELALGKDIPIIATDNLKHQFKLLSYLEKNHKTDVKTMLFDDLNADQEPVFRLQHPDGFPKLSYLAYKQIPDENKPDLNEFFLKKGKQEEENEEEILEMDVENKPQLKPYFSI